eukprot:gene14985-18951_t
MVGSVESTLRNTLSWGRAGALTLSVEWEDPNRSCVALPIPIDKLLPRLVVLCNQKSDLKMRILAAECLHGCVIYMVGRAAEDFKGQRRLGEGQKSSDYASVYAKVFPTVLTLAAAEDRVCRTLYHSLLMQLVHWFSGRNQVHTDEAEALLCALTAGLCSEDNGGLRVVCASALQEYFQWSIRQSTKKELETSSSAIDDLLSRVFVLALHPSPSYRQGAMAMFNRI